MHLHPIKVYADTSVFGGLFDAKFTAASAAFFSHVESGRFKLVLSPVVDEEIEQAPPPVRAEFARLSCLAERIPTSTEIRLLQMAYLDAGILTPKSTADAYHVASATVAACRVIVSWNFKHIVHFQKIPMYNGVNKINGYGEIAIHSPEEVIEDGSAKGN
jgi:predicted nucleic acid-binding protein